VVTPVVTPPATVISEVTRAVEQPALPSPTVISTALQVVNNSIQFIGKALPNEDVIVYVHSDQALIYRTKADSQGNWAINHSQDVIELAPGEHSIFAITYDEATKSKSRPSLVSTFTVSKSFWVTLYNYLSLPTTIVTIFVLLLTLLWLQRVRRNEPANA
jgi:hypothetical protein